MCCDYLSWVYEDILSMLLVMNLFIESYFPKVESDVLFEVVHVLLFDIMFDNMFVVIMFEERVVKYCLISYQETQERNG